MDRSSPPLAEETWLSDAPYLGFDGKEHRHRMGLRKLEPSAWLEPDAHEAAQVELKAQLLAERRAEVLYDEGTDQTRSAALALARLVTEAQGRDPDALETPAEATAADTLAAVAVTTQEDWCLMLREDTWRLRAACVCFPSRWVLAEKEGGSIAEIHGPVPRYAEQLGGLVERSMDRLDADRPVWRVNWNLWEDPRLFQPHVDPDHERWPLPTIGQLAERTFLRVERQTLRRLSDDAIAFSIRVHQRPLARLRDQAGAIELLEATVAAMAASPSAPKKLGRLHEPLQRWLRTELHDTPPTG
jgi:dimethylamine monooxygenase subunit A